MQLNNRTQNGTRNIVTGFVNRIVLILLPFCTRTIIVNILGAEYLGISSLFSAILNVLNLSELGFGSALVFSMYKPIAENDHDKLCALLKTYRKIYTLIGAAILFLGLALMPFLPRLIEGNWPAEMNLYVLYLILLGNTVVSYFAFAYKKALLTAYQRSDILSNVSSIVNIVLYGVQIVMLLTTKDYYIYIIMMPIFTLIDNVVVGVLSKRMFPQIRCQGTISKEDKQTIWQHVKGIALQKICSASRNSFDSIVISAYLGLTMTAIYGNYYYIMYSIHSILYLIPNSIRASVGNSVAIETQEKNYGDFKLFLFMYQMISSVCCVCLFCLYQPFMKLWMGEENMLPMLTVSLFCIYFLELCVGDIVALYKDAAGLWWHGRYRTVIEAIANLILNIVLGKIFGINGILIATIVTIVFLGIGYGGYIVYKHYFKNETIWDLVKEDVSCIGLTIVSIVISYSICTVLPVMNSFIELIAFLIIGLLSTFFVWFLFYRKSSVFARSKRMIVGIVMSVLKRQ